MVSSPKQLTILGSTGSIGTNCLDVVGRFPDRFQIKALAAGKNIKLLAKQIAEFNPEIAVCFDRELAEKLKGFIGTGSNLTILFGPAGYVEAASLTNVDIVVSAMVGRAGLEPTWAAVCAGKRVALANKETLVMAGELIMGKARETGAEILPVDSEHSAIFQVLAGQKHNDLRRIILTASGGPFLDKNRDQLKEVTVKQALSHPNWSMGSKITIDSATLMNKGLEAIEARWLFGLPLNKISVQIHPQSIVHSMVELVDGSVLAQMGVADMRLPIAYALSYPERLPLDFKSLNLPALADLNFRRPDLKSFPCLALAMEAGRRGGACPVVLNAANELAVQAFLDGRINFTNIDEVVRKAISGQPDEVVSDLEQVIIIDSNARVKACDIIEAMEEATS